MAGGRASLRRDGSIGPQKLDARTRPPPPANAGKAGATLYLFEVFERTRYVYAGEVELAGEPYRSDQTDARKESRFVWIRDASEIAPILRFSGYLWSGSATGDNFLDRDQRGAAMR